MNGSPNDSASDSADARWSAGALTAFDDAEELEIATARADGSLRRWVPIRVVRVEEQVYVRTWHRRETGWFGHALDTRRARVRVPGLEADVDVDDVGEGLTGLRGGVDDAYRRKYGRYGSGSVEPMVAEDAVASTLRLVPRASG